MVTPSTPDDPEVYLFAPPAPDTTAGVFANPPGTKPTEDDIRAFCKGQIAHYKVPRYIRFVAAFPMTVTGKIQKFKIRDEMTDQLGLVEAKTA